jgi:hypothetical protein
LAATTEAASAARRYPRLRFLLLPSIALAITVALLLLCCVVIVFFYQFQKQLLLEN